MTHVVRALVLLLLAVAAFGVHWIRLQGTSLDGDPAQIAALQDRLDALPLTLADGRYRGERRSHDQEIVLRSGAQAHAAAAYVDGNGDAFSLYIGGSTQPEVSFHPPHECLPASGWSIIERSSVPLAAFESPGGNGKMQRLLVKFGEQRMLAFSWFQSRRSVVDRIWKSRFFSFGERLRGPAQPTFIVILYVPVRGGVRRTEEAAREFMRCLGPHLLTALDHGD